MTLKSFTSRLPTVLAALLCTAFVACSSESSTAPTSVSTDFPLERSVAASSTVATVYGSPESGSAGSGSAESGPSESVPSGSGPSRFGSGTTAPGSTTAPASLTTNAPATSSTEPPTDLPVMGLPGVNDSDCASEHRPVILLPGTLSTVQSNYEPLAKALLVQDYCVYGINFGPDATQSVRTSAEETADFIGRVRKLTGADQVDVVGFSQGGLVLRTALRLYGAAEAVHTAALIGPVFHGSDAEFLETATVDMCAACVDMRVGSELLAELAAGGDLDGDVRYSIIISALDDIVTPYQSQIPDGHKDRVRSVVIQENCPDNVTEHGRLTFDDAVVAWVVESLDKDGLPDPTKFACSAD